MKLEKTWLYVLAGVSLVSLNQAACKGIPANEGIPTDGMGLSKTSVFADPAPEAYVYPQGMPGTTPDLPDAYPGAPPQIPHNIEAFLPVTASNNQCKGCHDNPAGWGADRQAGVPPSIPKTHYMEPAYGKAQAGLPEKTEKSLSSARFNCTQCHVPQAETKPLVNNTFGTAK
ncbi:MAG: nitrate reductase cytochrome c-type subunit [Pseudomonadota bacterium]|nr:nitrate reductase cytochrome c-type subunit [Pseudomonadota bacterium]